MAAANKVEFAELPLTRHRPFDDRLLRIIVDAGLTPVILADSTGEHGLAERTKEYGRRFPLCGGLEIRPILQGTRAIDEMVDRFFATAVDGGVFPRLIDRYGELIEVPWKTFEYFTRSFRKANAM